MWLVRVKEALHLILYACRHSLELGVMDPVPSSVMSEGEGIYEIFVYAFSEPE
jgi:hypothetical protein